MTSFYIDGHGCSKNQTDAELLAGFLIDNGLKLVDNPEYADYILVNSCGFIESAKKESIDSICELKASFPNSKIILCGCLAQRYSSLLLESMPELSGVFGNGDLSKIVDFIKNDKRQALVYPQSGICEGKRPYLFNYKSSAYVKITEGCSNHCSFCAIPIIRGELRSRKWKNIISEIETLVNDGVYEINLIGQDLAAFGTAESDKEDIVSLYKACNSDNLSPLAALFMQIEKIQGDFIVRPLYIHPDHFNTDILDVIKSSKKFIFYFDIPFQSGDNEIIKAMNRIGPASKYVDLIKEIRQKSKNSVIRTTFLTGFPGESQEAFENTKNFLKEIEPDWSGCFCYSREDDTPAFSFKKRVSGKVALKRADDLKSIQDEITLKKLLKYVGEEVDVLIEEIIKANTDSEDAEGLAIGRAWFQAPDVDGCVVLRYDLDIEEEKNCICEGNVVSAKVLAVTGVDLDARFVKLKKCFGNNSNRIYLS